MRTYVLDSSEKTPLYEQLYRALKEDILSGALRGGEKLPSKRALAEHLNVSRITVENAYNQLLTEGYLQSRPRSGYYVEQLDALPRPLPPSVQPLPPQEPPAPPSPSAGQFPFSIWAKLMRGVLLDQHDLLLRSPPNTGLLALRQAIAGILRRSRGMEVSPERIIIGAGAEYLYNILIQLLGRENCFGPENPGHQKIRRVYEANSVALCPVALDESGVDMRALMASGANVLHISPSHQFPTGLVTPIGRRRQLMAWLGSRPDRWLIEDDYDSEFRFDVRPLPSLQGMAGREGPVIYLSTFSRSLAPSIRIAYMVLPRPLLARWQQRYGLYSSTVSRYEQQTLARFIREGHFTRHLARMRMEYKRRRDGLTAALEAAFGRENLRLGGLHTGLHLLLGLQSGPPEAEMVARAAAAGVRLTGLSRYYHSSGAACPPSTVVLGYGALPPSEAEAAADALKKAWRYASVSSENS